MPTPFSLSQETIHWLTEDNNPGVRYLALRDLLETSQPELTKAAEAAHQVGPIATVLDHMTNEGYWVEPGPGYLPKYTSTVWSVILLGQLGASNQADPRIATACEYVLNHTLTEYGQFSASGTPGSTADCIQGNLCTALLDLGVEDSRLDLAYDWMARSLTGEGVAPMGDKSTPLRYYSGKCGPDFLCGANNKQACAWGAVKVMLAFSKLPKTNFTPLIQRAIDRGVDFLFSGDPSEVPYPNGWNEKPSGNWWKFGFPVFYVTDLLQLAESLVNLGYGSDPRLANTLALIVEKGGENQRWPMEYGYTGKTWVDFGPKKQPNKWVTYRAARVLHKLTPSGQQPS
ncbi:MAG: nitrogen fixation protein NifH [Anaerolineaceae bacterium]|nr:nitrogen fixation protein NifH [Anaerolineaceae bacterium]